MKPIGKFIQTKRKKGSHDYIEWVTNLVDVQNQPTPEDFISIADAQQLILLQTGRTVSHSTAARWVAQNDLGYKLPGYKGQWIVGGVMVEDYHLNIFEEKKTRGHRRWPHPNIQSFPKLYHMMTAGLDMISRFSEIEILISLLNISRLRGFER